MLNIALRSAEGTPPDFILNKENMKTYKLIYPKLKDLPSESLAHILGLGFNSFRRETEERIEQGRLSPGDLARAGIKVRPNDIKTLLRYSQEFKTKPLLTFNGEQLIFKGRQHQFSFYPEALGILEGKLKKGDIVTLADPSFEGPVPFLKLTNYKH